MKDKRVLMTTNDHIFQQPPSKHHQERNKNKQSQESTRHSNMNIDEMNREILECARYGEDDDLRTYLVAGADPNYCDESGNTSLHRAAANGEVKCILVLKEFGAVHVANKLGNFPIHWAAQNAKAESLKTLFEAYEVDVLAKNDAGRSTLTDAFDSKDVAVIELCLSHSSASEERLIETNDANAKIVVENDTDKGSSEPAKTFSVTEHAVSHDMQFRSDLLVKVRELPITRADNPFGSESAPEDDTTGLGIWPASIILSRWAVQCGAALMNNKVVVELGAGCGLPGIVAALHCRPKTVYITDIHEPTIANCEFNAQLNEKKDPHAKANASDNAADITYTHSASESDAGVEGALNASTAVRVLNVNWKDFDSFPAEKADVLLGSDLVYDSSILAILVPAVDRMMTQDGCLLYVAPNTGRDGMSELIDALAAVKIVCSESRSVPDEMYGNPLVNVDADYFVLHFYDLCAKQPHTLYKFQRQL